MCLSSTRGSILSQAFEPIATCAALLLLTGCLSARAAQSDPCSSSSAPPGAQALGYVHKVFCVEPAAADIAANDQTLSTLYSGKWYGNSPPPLSRYAMSGKTLVLLNGASLMSQTRKSLPAILPLLPAAAGFYVEFAERLSDNDPDHFPAVWLMPQEHDLAQSDHAPGEPAGFEQWVELDVDEGGFNTGHHGTMIMWSGVAPNYKHQNFDNAPASTLNLDRTQQHVFGLSYDPIGKKVAWWVDGVSAGSVSSADVPAIVNTHHYYLLMDNQNHGANHPYQMYVPYFSAWTGVPVPSAPSRVKSKTSP